MICKKCKKQIEEDSVFCRFCGKKQINEEITRKKQKRPNGSGSVVKLSETRRKPYEARVRLNGKQISIGTFATRTEALVALENANLHGISNIYNATVEDVYNMLLSQKQEKVTESAIDGYSASFGHLKAFANMPMRNMRTAHFQQTIDEAYKEGLSYSSIKKIQTLESMMCKIAMAHDLLNKNYASFINMPLSQPKSEKPSFTAEQLETLWQLSETDDTAAIIVALCYNGMRINEFFDLKKEHVDLDKRLIYAPGSKTEAGKDRIVVIPQDLVPIYNKMMQSPGEYLCSSPKGQRYDAKNFRNRRFYPFLDQHGLNPDGKITPNSSRHTYAWLCVKCELNQKATMDLIGHAKFSTTAEIYATFTAKDVDFLLREADKLRRLS
jgi:integrase